jgi:glyoxylase-like metal-dependent hydrolase (beta-lactamase superfamily II)
LPLAALQTTASVCAICSGFFRAKAGKISWLMWVLLTLPFMNSPRFIRPDLALKKMNLAPEVISDIIITHPHADHIGCIDLFPTANVWMQKKDFEYFVGAAWQVDGFSDGFSKKDVRKIVEINLQGRLKLVEGDDLEILPGIRVFTGSKHTFENQYLLVNAGSGSKVLLASDAIWFYYNLDHLLPIPKYTFDPKTYVEAMKRMKRIAPDKNLIIPGHDDLVFSKFTEVAEGIVKIGKRQSLLER